VGNTTTTDPRSRRNRVGRRGGQLLTRALGSSYTSACPLSVLPVPLVPDGHTIRRNQVDPSRTRGHRDLHTGYQSAGTAVQDGISRPANTQWTHRHSGLTLDADNSASPSGGARVVRRLRCVGEADGRVHHGCEGQGDPRSIRGKQPGGNLPNKTARSAWAILAYGREFQSTRKLAAASAATQGRMDGCTRP
jgi:hypothetical protein